ncbi:LysR family transcriptional regulator [Pacificibacter marinus]|uniref:LysR family transcriptional regulator n=1 Tax=Pacificibacter marinus TaxID=658057 RepID=UPI001C0679CF|nr:LysR family transcriptional regulator [Pacificibacter marinus]MBU2868348.1 LysR family transcriptional regulator [Pacificibacter marinus]
MANPRQYAHFIAVLEQGTLLGAAQMVNLSQPALSKSILTLEDEYGVKLFDRHPRGLMPTVYGQALEHHARRILFDIDQSKHDLTALEAGSSGRVRIGVGQALIKFVEDALVELETDFPDANHTVITSYAEGLRLALQENRVDVVLGMVNRLVEDEEFVTTIVANDHIVGLCHQSHPLAGQEVSLEQLRGQDWVVPERGEVVRSALEAFYLLNREPLPRFKVVTNIPDVVGRFVRDFNLLSLSPSGSFYEFQNFGVASFEIKNFQFERQIGLVRRAGVAINPLSAAFEKLLRKTLKDAFEHPVAPTRLQP